MPLDKAGDRGDQLREAGTQGDHGQADDGIGDAERCGDEAAVVYQKPGADGDGSGPDHQEEKLLRERFLLFSGAPLFRVLFFGALRELRALSHLHGGYGHIDHEHRQIADAHPALKAAGSPGDHRIRKGRCEEKGGRQRKSFRIHFSGPGRDGDRRDQAGVADDRADGIAVADTGVALQSCLTRDHDLWQRRAD